MNIRWKVLLGISFYATLCSGLSSKQDLQVSPALLVNEMVREETKALSDDQTYWRYRKLKKEAGKEELHEIVETSYGRADRLLALNGHALAANDERIEEARLGKLVADSNKARAEQNKHAEDVEKGKHFLQILPTCFYYSYDGVDGNLIKLSFRPNPTFQPDGWLDRIVSHVEGTMRIERRDKRLAQLDGHVTSEIKFGGGLFGHLNQGGTFSIKQEKFNPNYWTISLLDIQVSGRALLFKTLSVQEKVVYTDYEIIPPGTTLQQAVQILTTSRPTLP